MVGLETLTPRQMRLAAWSVFNIRNWYSVIESRRRARRLSSIVLRSGLNLSVKAKDCQPFFEIFAEKRYDHPDFLIPRDGVIVDVGANIGFYSVYAATRLVPEGRVFAFEPIPACAEVIETNCRRNGIDNVTVFQLGVGKQDGVVPFHIAERSGDSSLFAVLSSQQIESAVVLSPRRLFAMFSRIDLIKVDCEGAEFILLWEADKREWEKVAAVSMEYHLGLNTGYPDGNPTVVADRLVELGFRVLSHQPTKDPRFGYIRAQRS